MKRRPFFILLGVLVMVSVTMAACAPAAPALPYEEIAYDEPLVVAADSCDYGGKIKEIRALDELTVQFTMCKPDPAFLAKAAFTPFSIQPREYNIYRKSKFKSREFLLL